jgi:hypothetical protein
MSNKWIGAYISEISRISKYVCVLQRRKKKKIDTKEKKEKK